ncbi:MAG: glycosyltransferase family 4 protein [Pirellulaceae bacterium]|nr:glycosyltransferase family 4 protein [Pirellulaceae bacterium]
MNSTPHIAVVHEWLATYAGSEKVVEQMLATYPAADLWSIVDFLPAKDRAMLGGRDVRTSFLQRLPFARRAFRAYLPLMPLAVEQFDLDRYDVVLSSNHAVAKGVLTRADQLHISYVHTPIRYAWDLQHQYLREAKLGWGPRGLLARAALHYLRLWDRAAADRVDLFVANSRYVARRIEKTYRRPAEVIYPPVDIERFTLGGERDDYYLAASRLVPYKRIDLIVEAFRNMPGKKLVVIGDGPDFQKIAAKRPPNVELLGYQDGPTLVRHLQTARALVFAADEDFGILPVEAQACGTPVIAYGRGGATETVLDGESGLLFAEQTPAAIVAAVERFERWPAPFEAERIRANAERFSIARFRAELAELVERRWRAFQAGEAVEQASATLRELEHDWSPALPR